MSALYEEKGIGRPIAGSFVGHAPRRARLLRRHDTLLYWWQFLLDSAAAILPLVALVYLRFGYFGMQYRVLLVVSILLAWIFSNNYGVHRRHTNAFGVMVKLAKSWGATLMSLLFIGFISKTSALFSRPVILSWVMVSFSLQLLAHMILPELLLKFRGAGGRRPALLIGANRLGVYLAEKINRNPWLPFQIVGVVDSDPAALARWKAKDIPALGGEKNLGAVIKEHGIESVYISKPMGAYEEVERLYLDLLDKNVDVSWAPDISGVTLVNHNVKEIAGVPLFAFSETPLIGSRALLKSAVDKTLAAFGIIVASPLMLLTAIAVKLSSPGPVIFRQKRHGWNGKEFEVWKFRSMRIHTEEKGVITQATRDDSRVTWIGRIIRRLSVDELPQLFNVLQGTMSLVGPRPHPLEINDRYSRSIGSYFARHRIKPGITGLAQVNGLRGETRTLDKMRKRVEYDMEYINNWSIGLDIRILAKTVFALFSRNAY